MKIIDAIREAISDNRQFFGVEFFPPHMDAGRLKLYDCMERLFQQDAAPMFCGVTWGDRGSTSKETIGICDAAQRLASPVVMQVHVTGAGATEAQMREWLADIKRRDLRNVFLLRGVQIPRVGGGGCVGAVGGAGGGGKIRGTSHRQGGGVCATRLTHAHHHHHHQHQQSQQQESTCGECDEDQQQQQQQQQHQQQQEQEQQEDPFQYAVDLVKFVRKHFGDYFGITVAAYPEGCTAEEDRAAAIRHLKEKVDAGADLVICQAVFDARVFLKFCEDCRGAGITCPIIPSVVPIHNAAQLRRMTNLRRLEGMDRLEETIRERVSGGASDDDEAVRGAVVDFTAALVRQFFRAGVRGVYFMTQNVDSVTRKVVAQISELARGGGGGGGGGLASIGGGGGGGGGGMQPERPLMPWRVSLRRAGAESARPIYWSSRPSSYLASLDGIARYDDHPNGRWSSAASPAFGEQSTYQHVTELVNASAKLCSVFMQVRTLRDVATVFVDFLRGRGSSLPWCCAEGLAPESNALIEQVLVPMNARGMLTINSQPAVNGAPSEDAVYGWGPKGGCVYQKNYLEFFCSPQMLDSVASVFDGFPSITYMAQTREKKNRRMNFALRGGGKQPGTPTSVAAASGGATSAFATALTQPSHSQSQSQPSQPSQSQQPAESLHAAVTWGVFPNKDVLQPTFVSSSAFDAWTPEAFTMWLYPFHGSAAPVPAVIEDIVESWFLVTALDNDYTSQPTPINQAVARLCASMPEL